MTKTVKGFINKGKKGSYGISTSVYNGQDAIKDVQEKVIASLEAFGFKKSESKNNDWLSYSLWVNDLTEDEKQRLEDAIGSDKKRISITLSRRKDKKGNTFGIVSIADVNTNDTTYIMKADEKEVSLYGYINKLDNGSVALSTSVKVDDKEIDDRVASLLAIGYNEGESKNENYRNFSMWLNKPTEYEQELIKENGRYKYTLKVVEFRDNISKIDRLISVEEIEENASEEDKNKAEDEAEF